MTLTEIANSLACDKGTTAYERHGYTQIYEGLIAPSSRMLEIGIDKGLSVTMWKQWSADLNLIAIDNNAECITSSVAAMCDARMCDQSDVSQLESLAESLGPESLDVIIDDGSHRPDDQLLTLETLWKCLRSGGRYFVEDLHTSNWFPMETRAPNRLKQFAGRNAAVMHFACQNKLACLVKP